MVEQVIANMMDTDAISHLSSQEQDEYLQKSLKIIQELSDQSTKDEPLETKDFECIDLFTIRILSLVICRGQSRDKATMLANLINEDSEEKISWDNERMQKAIKIILYCSSILPNKFLSLKRDQNVFKKIMCHDPKSIKMKRFKNIQRLYAQNTEIEHGYIWSEKDIQNKEDIFEDVFNQFFSDKVKSKLFPKGTDSITKGALVQHLTMLSNHFDLKNVQFVTSPT